MTLLKDNDYKEINVALLSLEADIKKLSNNGGFDTSVIDRQLAEINSRIDKINATGNNSSAEINDIRTEIENINSKVNGNSVKIENIEQKLADIFSADNKVTDFNTTTGSGIYYWVEDAANRPANYGVLLVNKYDSGSGSIWINQVAYGTNNKIYFRQNINSGSWTEWKAVVFDGEKVSAAVTADKATRLKTFASWDNPYVYDATNGVRVNVYKITMPNVFNSILVQIYDDINFARCRKYFLGLWHAPNYGYNVSVTDLGGTKANGLKVWMGTDGNVYLQADVYWTSRISFSYLEDQYDLTISVTKIGVAPYGSNKDVDGTVLFTPLTDSIMDCGAIRADDRLSAASKEPEFLKAYWLYASNKMVIPIGAPSSLEDGCIWIS